MFGDVDTSATYDTSAVTRATPSHRHDMPQEASTTRRPAAVEAGAVRRDSGTVHNVTAPAPLIGRHVRVRLELVPDVRPNVLVLE